MDVSSKSRDLQGNDDISGLFARFGAAGREDVYRDFEHHALPAVEAVNAPAPGLHVTDIASADWPVQAAAAATHDGRDHSTPLAQLFRRLLQHGAAPDLVEGPLKRLLTR